ncbi:MAG: hypothetical protein KA399_05970 [Chitinophagaceae bacterium]|jgi:hypothetical protein|nr:hypothetical protein [Chitinophagaceae bacterium]
MNKCITCKHWKQWSDTPNYGACFFLAIFQNMEQSIFPATKALKNIKSGDKVFNTGKYFGCVHHSENEKIKTLNEIRENYKDRNHGH